MLLWENLINKCGDKYGNNLCRTISLTPTISGWRDLRKSFETGFLPENGDVILSSAFVEDEDEDEDVKVIGREFDYEMNREYVYLEHLSIDSSDEYD